MKRHKSDAAANNNRKRPKINVVAYIRVGTAAQLEEPKTGFEIPYSGLKGGISTSRWDSK